MKALYLPLAAVGLERTADRLRCRRKRAAIPKIRPYLLGNNLVREERARLERSSVKGTLPGGVYLDHNAPPAESVAARAKHGVLKELQMNWAKK